MAKGPQDYEVGYGKPPKHSRFPPGRSGNPKGRKKGARGLKTDLAAELGAKQTIQINGKPYTGTRQQLTLMTVATRAAAGNLNAAKMLLPLIVQVLGVEDRGVDRKVLSAEDQAILDAMLGDAGVADPEPDADERGAAPDDPQTQQAVNADEHFDNAGANENEDDDHDPA